MLKQINISSSIELINSRYFITYFDNFVKGGIMEKVFAEKMQENYLKLTNNNNLKNKNILFNQAQNTKHYDLGLKLFNQGNNYCFFQVTFHKPDKDVINLLNNLWTDLNYGITLILKIIYHIFYKKC